MSLKLQQCLCEVKHINARVEKSADGEVPALDLKLELDIDAAELEQMLPGKAGYSLIDCLWDEDGDMRWPQLSEFRVAFEASRMLANIDKLSISPATLHKVKVEPQDHGTALMTCTLSWFASGKEAAKIFEHFLGKKARFSIEPLDGELDLAGAA